VSQPNVTVYGSKQCPDTVHATRWLAERGIPYEFKDVDETPEYNDFIAGLNGGKRVMPTIRVNNETMFNPPEDALDHAIREAIAPTPT
jgi:glutaredoxin